MGFLENLSIFFDERAQCISLLLDHGASINTRTLLGSTALMMAVENNRPSCWKRLIDEGADSQVVRINGKTALELGSYWTKQSVRAYIKALYNGSPLHKAVRDNSLEDVRILICSDFYDINIRGRDGWTALHLASYLNRLEIVILLLELGADSDCKTYQNQSTPLHLACSRGNVQTTKVLLWFPTTRNLEEDCVHVP